MVRINRVIRGAPVRVSLRVVAGPEKDATFRIYGYPEISSGYSGYSIPHRGNHHNLHEDRPLLREGRYPGHGASMKDALRTLCMYPASIRKKRPKLWAEQ
ncbi:hypothetical protein TNCV_4012121 [Trichonephila clavipes]|nr:hypothetical protein TNCV_4012121 [Trichonephila clavipes]